MTISQRLDEALESCQTVDDESNLLDEIATWFANNAMHFSNDEDIYDAVKSLQVAAGTYSEDDEDDEDDGDD